MFKIRIGFVGFLFFIIVCCIQSANAAVPHLINYQGRLTDSGGAPLNGSYAITFRLYDAETAGVLLWQEIYSGLVIQKGIFSVLLGSVTALNLPFDKQYYLAVQIGSDPEMTPRQRIASSAYALRAENADQALQSKNSDTVGNVGVSATATAGKLLPLDANAKLPVSVLKTYDSGWFAVAVNNNYVKTHNLGTTKIIANVMFSMNSDGAGSTMFHMGVSETGNPRQASMMSLTAATITIAVPTTGMAAFVDTSGVLHDLTSGYCRIIMLALE